jgi:hypothetical protein
MGVSTAPFAIIEVYMVWCLGTLGLRVRSYLSRLVPCRRCPHWITPRGRLRCSSVNDIPTHFVIDFEVTLKRTAPRHLRNGGVGNEKPE